MCRDDVLLETALPLPLLARGKVRDLYDLGQSLLFIATDRISAFDCVLGSGIPCKGKVLTQMSLFWFNFLKDVVPTHLISADVTNLPEHRSLSLDALQGRSMIVEKANVIQIECVARGYLAGSGWKEYKSEGTVCGISLPAGLNEGDRLPAPIFTPATKAQSGHDMNVSFSAVCGTIGRELATRLRDLTLDIYHRAAAYTIERGIILADTKFEFGFVGEKLLLADEVLTPDSSRYWPADTYKPGVSQLSFDKQYVRDYLETIAWDKMPPAPSLPADVIEKTSNKYQEAYRRITGQEFR